VKILEMRALRGPNYYSRYPVIYMELDIGELEDRPSDHVEGIAGRLESLMPTIKSHRCSRGYEGGFLERVNEGTWAGHIAEHVAIELQCMAKLDVGFGKTIDTDEKGIYKVVFRYRDEAVALAAGEFAVDIVSALFDGQEIDVAPMVHRLKEIREEHQLGPSTKSIVDEAKKRGIPMIRLNDESYIQLGYGVNQRRIQATMTDTTSAIGVEITDDKMLTKEILEREGVPVPNGGVALPKKALELASEIGFPVVVKPLIGNHGRGISINITSEEELKMAVASARKIHEKVIIERYIEGMDHRILVINRKFVAAARREPTPIIGDGTSTIRELIKEINKDPRRGIGHEKVLTKLEVDYMTKRLLKLRKMSLDTVLEKGKRIIIKSTANLSMGGIAVDVTDEVHPNVRAMAERVARIVNLDIMGIDVIAKNLRKPLKPGEAGVVEINAAPGFRMHIKPFEGRPRNVAKPVLDMLFPPGSKSTIPLIAVTGTNGKTTTVRLISHILKYCGKNVGTACTDGIIIENHVIYEGDYSGPQGATTVLKDKTVDHAVLEVARGGLLRRGLTVDESDVGVILNVANDHLGEGGINTVEELAELKGIIADTVKPDGYAVLNADDPLVLRMKENLKCKCILFSLDPMNPALASHIEAGGTAITVNPEGMIVIMQDPLDSLVAKVVNIPITLEGKADFNVANALAATAAAFAIGIGVEDIRAGLVTFNPTVSQLPGRMNIIDVAGFKVMIDYGHNTPALEAMAKVLPHITFGRKISVSAGTGNRTDEDIRLFGKTLAGIYDEVIITDTDRRRRKVAECPDLVREGMLSAGFPEDRIRMIIDGREAVQAALNTATEGDLVVIQADDVKQIIEDVMAYKEEYKNRVLSNKSSSP